MTNPNDERTALRAKLLDAPQTPVSRAALRWIELANDVEHHTGRLNKLRSDNSDKTMVNFIDQRLKTLRNDYVKAAMDLADIPARNARDIFCKLMAATQTEPNTKGAAEILFELSQSSRQDLKTFLNYAEARKSKTSE
jgi:hypothetical protein